LSGILVVDDHPVIERACRLLLEANGVGSIIAARDVGGGRTAFLQHRPDVVILDLSLNGERLASLAFIQHIRSLDPNARILVFSMHDDSGSFAAAIEAGATGYLIKDSPTAELEKAVRRVRSGHRYIDSQLALKLAFPGATLSPREGQLITVLLDGSRFINASNQVASSDDTLIDLRHLFGRQTSPSKPG